MVTDEDFPNKIIRCRTQHETFHSTRRMRPKKAKDGVNLIANDCCITTYLRNDLHIVATGEFLRKTFRTIVEDKINKDVDANILKVGGCKRR